MYTFLIEPKGKMPFFLAYDNPNNNLESFKNTELFEEEREVSKGYKGIGCQFITER